MLFLGVHVVYAQESPGEPTSATDHKVRLEKVKRINPETGDTETRRGRVLARKKVTDVAKGSPSKVYRRHRHFASREIRMRSRSRAIRKETLGVGTE